MSRPDGVIPTDVPPPAEISDTRPSSPGIDIADTVRYRPQTTPQRYQRSPSTHQPIIDESSRQTSETSNPGPLPPLPETDVDTRTIALLTASYR